MHNIHEIVDLIVKDDKVAFNRFYDQYYEQVFHFAFYFLKETEPCKEIVSDVFFSIWQNRQKLSKVVDVETWLYVLVKNRSLRYLEETKKNIVFFDDDMLRVAVHLREEDLEPMPDELLMSKELDSILTDAINALPQKCRTIFVMCRKNGLKTKDVAVILSLRESTVRVQLKIAIEKIIEAVKPHFPGFFA